MLQTACANFTRFTTWVQLWTYMNCLDFKVKGPGHDMVKHGQKSTEGILKVTFTKVSYSE